MRQLRSCDFCGADAEGVYEVIPDRHAATDADQRRVVLCQGCRERLGWILEPLLDRLDGDAESDVESATTASNPSLVDEGVTLISDADAADDDATDHDEASSRADERADTPSDSADEADETDEADADAAVTTPSPGERAPDDTHPKYRQVMRFLGNRDLPIDRMEAESLASGAYDLDASEVADIVDAAIERGLLVEEDGQLRAA